MPTTTSKPRWVECLDEASTVLTSARTIEDPEARDAVVREAHAWMHLAGIYRDGPPVPLT